VRSQLATLTIDSEHHILREIFRESGIAASQPQIPQDSGRGETEQRRESFARGLFEKVVYNQLLVQVGDWAHAGRIRPSNDDGCQGGGDLLSLADF
jgi:hypothetical protein